MAFQVSPGVITKEIDLSNIIPNVSTSTGATVIASTWGAVEEVTIVNSEEEMVSLFGKPTSTNYKDFFSCTSFLAYASGLKVVRVVGDGALNSTASASAGTSGLLIKNLDTYEATSFTASTDLWIAKCPGVLGNSVGVAWADTTGFNATNSAGDYTWDWHTLFDSAPDTDEFHVVVYDADGTITGTVGTALEKFAYVSTVSTALYYDGTSGYFKNRINNGSAWIWVAKPSLLTDTSDGVTLAGGADGSTPTDGNRETGWDLFVSDLVDISLAFVGGGSKVVGKYIIDNLVEVRKDCVGFVSVEEDDVVNITNTATQLTNIKATRDYFGSSSYAVMDSAYKYTYDRYNDVNRWVPLNGDVAGLCAKTDSIADPWFSPAGLNRGQIKNAIKLTGPQPLSVRDELYKAGINPCVVFPLEGPVLYGDKTLLTRPSSFSRINVRRLFIVLEKAISTASKYFLFEQNDEFTRARFVNMVEPFLRDVQGRRGIIKFKVVCDENNNPANVVDNNTMVGSIFIRPTTSINFIELNFVNVSGNVTFEEKVLTGQF